VICAIHVCSCGRSYSSDMWAALPLAGYQQSDDPDYLLELRECTCGSHRALKIEGPGYWLGRVAQRALEAQSEARAEYPALANSALELMRVCMRQAEEQLKILLEQRERRARGQFRPRTSEAAE